MTYNSCIHIIIAITAGVYYKCINKMAYDFGIHVMIPITVWYTDTVLYVYL
jgi:hypothetical protein